jgi:hypothetical protein
MFFNLINPDAAKLFLTFSSPPPLKPQRKHNDISCKHLGLFNSLKCSRMQFVGKMLRNYKKKKKKTLVEAKPCCTNFSLALLHARLHMVHTFFKNVPPGVRACSLERVN